MELLLSCLVLLTQGCAMTGVRRVTILDSQGGSLNGILVVPLYANSGGVGFGAEGDGPHSVAQLLVNKPFMFNSGEDLMSKLIQIRGVIIPFPFPPWCCFVGKSHVVESWLLMKEHYVIKALHQNDIYLDSPIVMTLSTGNECERVIGLLLQPNVDQQTLKKLFNVEWLKGDVQVNLDTQARALLDSQRHKEPK